MTPESDEPAFEVPGFPDLDSKRLQFLFRAFAEVLSERPLGSFMECNELVGSANGLASGIVRFAIRDLGELGYLRRVPTTGGVELTAKGSTAARAAGIIFD
jgi:hypothetical protein